MEVRLTDQANEDLFLIWDYIAESSERTADQCVARIMACTHQLLLFPKSGVKRSDIGLGARMLPVERWLVFYRIAETEIQIVRIVDAARDLRDLTFPRE